MARPGTKHVRGVFQGSAAQRSLFDPASEEVTEREVVDRNDVRLRGFDPCLPEASYRQVVPDEHRRRFGQYFTPKGIAQLMSEWIASINPQEVLDPAVGTGVLVRCVSRVCPSAALIGVDVDPLVLAVARETLQDVPQLCLEQSDFLNWQPDRHFEAVIANPPYLKHHNFSYAHDIFEEIGRRNEIRLSRLTNIYALFVFEICRRLNEGGRAAVVIPGEWANANFGEAFKRFLLGRGYLRALLYFSHESLKFDDALTTASVLLLEKGDPAATVTTVYVKDTVEVEALMPILGGHAVDHPGVTCQQFKRQQLNHASKWDQLLRGATREHHEGFATISTIARTRRGIATGSNEYFLLSEDAAQNAQLRKESLLACIGKARDVIGLRFTQDDFRALATQGRPCMLVNLSGRPTDAERAYIARGESLGLQERYLLAARTPWYSMEQRKPAPIWAAVFGRRGLRFIWNRAGVYNLTAFHGIYTSELTELEIKALVAALNSHLVQQLAMQQQRVYGGGLRKYEPKDLLEIEIPQIWKCCESTVGKLAALLDEIDDAQRRQGEIGNDLNVELDRTVASAAQEAAQCR